MHVYCDLFDVLDIAERNEDFLQLKLLPLLFFMFPTSPFCQRQVAYMKSPTYFVYACLV